MSVNKIDRRESSVEFDNNYYRIYSDAGKIIDNYFGIKKPLSDMQLARLRTATERIMRVVFDIGTYLYETFVMSEQDIYSNYKSWRNALIKDCKNCKRTIKMMDRYYYSLFPKHHKKNKETREKIIQQAFKELENKYILITNF